MPSTSPAATISSVASMSSLPANGSPIWTLGRIAAEPSSKAALASTDAPPMPSRPVGEPNSTASAPGVGAMARAMLVGRAGCLTHITLTSGLPVYVGSKASSPPTVGTPTQLP